MTTHERFSIRQFIRDLRDEWRRAEKRAFNERVMVEVERRRAEIARLRGMDNER